MANAAATRRFRRIACVQLDARLPDFCSKLVMPRYGLPVIGAVLRQAGYEVRVFVEHVAPPDLDAVAAADAILLSALTGAATRTYELVDALRRRTRAPIVLGGEHATSFADDALDWVDFVVRLEGDETILALLSALEAGRGVEDVSGLSYRAGERKVHNPPGPPPRNIHVVHDLEIIHGYPREDGLWLAAKRGKAKIICVQSTRGCPYDCGFCVTPRLFRFSYRARELERVIEDIERKLPFGREFLFVDNLFAVDRERTRRLLERMIERGIGERAVFTCFCRVEVSRDAALLALMRRAGIGTICLGLESIDDATLDGIDKRQHLPDMIAAIEAIRAAGIQVSGSFIAGCENDTRDSLLATVDFCVARGLYSFFFISLWYYPGDPRCPMPPERLIIPSFDYCTGSFVTHFPARMRPSTLQRTLVDAQRRFWGLARAVALASRGDFAQAIHVAAHRHAFREVERHQLEYASFLESMEHGYYDERERLRADRIGRRQLDPIVRRALASGVVALDSQRQRSVAAAGGARGACPAQGIAT
jgi:radical SAM superfamily enzyme YgiQ (UPF0313 family)